MSPGGIASSAHDRSIMPASYRVSICFISRHLQLLRLPVARSRCRVPSCHTGWHFKDARAVHRVPRKKLADVAVAISSMFLEIDLRHDGTRRIAFRVETAGLVKQAYGILSHLTLRASP